VPSRAAVAPAPPPAGDLADQIFEGLVRLAWGARQHDQSLQREHGVTAAQLSALRVLERHGEQTHSELSERLFLRGSTVSGMVDRLEERGLIVRRRAREDRRLVRVALAADGKRLLASIPKGQSKFGALRKLVRELPPADARSFLRTLDKMVSLLGGDAAAAPAPARRGKDGGEARPRRRSVVGDPAAKPQGRVPKGGSERSRAAAPSLQNGETE
jgi:DNA-binding MarR family transcriptional regulator